jgi:hypothetical protein
MAFVIIHSHCAHNLAQGLGGGRGELWDADPPHNIVGAHKTSISCASMSSKCIK